MPPEESADKPKNKLSISFDLRIVVAILLVIIIAMVAIWRPWSAKTTGDRTITVSGEATVKAEPDEYVFYPSYQFKNADKDTALDELTKKSNTIVAELKKLGVEDSRIKTDSSGYGDYPVSGKPETNRTTYTLSVTVTVGNKELAQKVQNYLVTTSPAGAVTPQPTFSDAKRKQLENQARDAATKDARAKADQSAENLGFKIGKVKQVSDGSGLGGVFPLSSGAALEDSSRRQLTLQPGENDLNYSVTVIYYVD